MLLIKTFLKTDSYGGIGLFANENIPKDKLVWEWNDLVDKMFTPEEFDKFPPPFQDFIKRHGYSPAEEIFGKKMICINLDDARFFNHPDDPNTTEIKDGVIIANRDIKKGEEITCDYRLIDNDNEFCGNFLTKSI
ncbi:MAG: SET domain-containing protein [Candidatus Paceibacterota bacterium]